jgi:hypothetical protein
MYEKALELDPSYALANALLAYTLLNEWLREVTDSKSQNAPTKHRMKNWWQSLYVQIIDYPSASS